MLESMCLVIVIINLYSAQSLVSNALKRPVVNSEWKIGFKETFKDVNGEFRIF